MDLHTILVLGHIVGTILGVGGATIAEVQVLRALKDGAIDASERALMHANYTVIRVGTAIVVVSGILLVWWHLAQGNDWVLSSEKLWMKDLMVVVIIANAVLLHKRLVPLWLGSALSFTSWWGATVLGVWRGVPFSFLELLIGYVIAVGVVAGVLTLIRRYALPVRERG